MNKPRRNFWQIGVGIAWEHVLDAFEIFLLLAAFLMKRVRDASGDAMVTTPLRRKATTA